MITQGLGQGVRLFHCLRRTIATFATRDEGTVTEQLAHRDLRNRSAEILRNVAAGASYEITNHGEVVALLTPPAPDGRLRIRAGTSRRPFSQIQRVQRSESTQSALDDLRGDR